MMVDTTAPRGAYPTGEMVKAPRLDKKASALDPNVGRLPVDSRLVADPVEPAK